MTKTICVFCGSRSGTDPDFTKDAETLGKLFLENNWGLVYGGGTTGIMGTIARAIASNGGKVHGIIPQALIKRERNNEVPEIKTFGETTIVQDMHTRKRLMGQQAEAFVALPGGYGTLEELFEAITWNQLGIHSRPIILLNTNGFFSALLQWVDSTVTAGLISPQQRDIMVAVDTPEEVIGAIKNYKVSEGRLDLDWSSQGPPQQNGTTK